jgi:hypothetical protein
MSSLKKLPAKSTGASSKGPSVPAGKLRSPLNTIRQGLCAKCIVLNHESRENFLLLLQQHIDRFRPADEVEFGMIEEMCSSYWRQRRVCSLETGMVNKQMALQPDGNMTDRMAVAFDTLAASPSLTLLHREESRLHLMYQRALRTLIMLRTIERPNEDAPNEDLPNEPSPISEHSPPALDQPGLLQKSDDSEALSGADNPTCSRVSASPGSLDARPSAPLRRPKASGAPN